MYSFTDEQNDILTELTSDHFTESWSKLIYGYSFGDEDVVYTVEGNSGDACKRKQYSVDSSKILRYGVLNV